jgi:prepilin-type N-terminal cleavage/methylation domain-containing protein
MNKKGFTLVELLAVIVILGILSTFLVPSIFKMVKNAKEKSYNVLIGSFEENARLFTSRHRDEIESYLDQYNYYSLTLNDLKSDNLLKTPIIDPRTDEEINLNNKIYVLRETDNTLSICYEERGCYAPIKLADKIIDPSTIVSGNIDGLHQDTSNNFYYYAGSNPYNWIEFSGKLWRIVKVNSDRSIQIIYEGTKSGNSTNENGAISNGPFDNLNTNSYNGNVTVKTTLQDWYNANIDEASKAMVLPIQWCVGKVAYSTSGVSKSSFLSSECTTKTTNTYSAGLLLGSEYLYASLDAACLTSYKTSGDYGNTCKNQNYLYKNVYNYWTTVPDNNSTNVWVVNVGGSLGAPVTASNSNHIRPVITLRNDVYIDRGDGTFNKPFVLKNLISVDKTNPVITLLGSNPVILKQGETFIDAGATAIDNVDGNITNKILKVSNINVNIAGKYKVTYIVSDISGNKTSIDRIVEVQTPENYGLTFYLEADDFKNTPQSTTLIDRSINAMTITPTNFAYTTSSGSDGAGGIVFDGVDDYITTPTINTGNAAWTISIWAKTTSTAELHLFTNSNSGPVYNSLMISSSKISYNYYSTAWTMGSGTINVADGNWHMLTWINYSDGTMDLYVDKNKDTTLSGVFLYNSSPGPINVIGKNWSPIYYKGSISDIRMYNRTLSSTEVGLIYDLNKR